MQQQELLPGTQVLYYPDGKPGIPKIEMVVQAPYADHVPLLNPGIVPVAHVRAISFDEKTLRIRRQLGILFRDSIGHQFRVKGTEIHDYITGLNSTNTCVEGEHCNVFIDLVELTGKRKDEEVITEREYNEDYHD